MKKTNITFMAITLMFTCALYAVSYEDPRDEYVDPRDEYVDTRDEYDKVETLEIKEDQPIPDHYEEELPQETPQYDELGEEYMDDFSGQSDADTDGLPLDGRVDQEISNLKLIIG